ncbi:hypothetical protein KUTeg_016242 [Tegillarca granosa]|uniref:Uncharacterized protein n=1 Tax=Tegillarca granosa TaxID=220873 RepID=A0ABQ9EQ26_TEGGR|nr:hypothetical protein KUTeg_016242 [Tegillarca granosa]
MAITYYMYLQKYKNTPPNNKRNKKKANISVVTFYTRIDYLESKSNISNGLGGRIISTNSCSTIPYNKKQFSLYGIPEESYAQNQQEDYESLIRKFIRDQLDITDDIEFENVHRFGRRFNDRPRKIVAGFTRFKQRELVLKIAKILAGTWYRISGQFSLEIKNKRKERYSVLRKARDGNNKTFLKVDKPYVNGKVYVDPELHHKRHSERKKKTGPSLSSLITECIDARTVLHQ